MRLQKTPRLDAVSARARYESDAACQVANLLRREFGLASGGAEAELSQASLTVRLCHALTPMGCLIARSQGGIGVVQGAYDALHAACRERLHREVTQILGLPVCRSWIEVQSESDVLVRFDFNLSLPPPTASRLPKIVAAAPAATGCGSGEVAGPCR